MRKNGQMSYGFTTYSHKEFSFYGKSFYPNLGKKIIPSNIENLLTPLVITIWFMDDGSWKSKTHDNFIIHTLGHTKDDLERIQKVLFHKFGLDSSLHSQKNKNWRIYFPRKSTQKFREMISPLVNKFSSMKHKLGNINA